MVALAGTLGLPSVAGAAPSFVPEGKPFGFNTTLQPAGEAHPSDQMLDAAAAAGATHIRLLINWRAYENVTSPTNPVPPSFQVDLGQPTGDWYTDRADAEYLAVTARGMKPSVTIFSAPHWASHFHRCTDDIVYRLSPSNCPPDWRTNRYNVLYPAADRWPQLRAFTAALAQRYPLAQFEGTNEPDYQRRTYARYHPPLTLIAEAQCQITAAVKAVDPQRPVLSPSILDFAYAREYLQATGGRTACFDMFNLHLYSAVESRSGQASSVQGELFRFLWELKAWGHTNGLFLTETGTSDKIVIPDENYNSRATTMGEPLVAKGFPAFMSTLANHPDVRGLFIHTVREGAFAESSEQAGFGLLSSDYTIKVPGQGIMPRFCYLVLTSGNTWPGCDAYPLPGPPEPAAPSFFQEPRLLWDRNETRVGKHTSVLFLEEGHPTPNVSIVWYRCNGIGLGCVVAMRDVGIYPVTSADRFKTIKAGVTIYNEHGALYRETRLSPFVTD